MKRKFYFWILGLALFIGCLPLQAQTQGVQLDSLNKLVLRNIGATFGFGTANVNLHEMNNSLQELRVGQLDDKLTTLHFSIYAGFKGGFGLSADINFGTSLGGREVYNTNAAINLNTFSFGPTLYYSLLTTNRVRLMALAGLRMNSMSFKYNANTLASPDFEDLLANPAASGSVKVMRTSIPARSATLGARLQYRLGKKENLKSREYSLGIDSGYNHSFDAVPWSEPLSKTIIRGMPAIKPNHFYLNFTFSALLIR